MSRPSCGGRAANASQYQIVFARYYSNINSRFASPDLIESAAFGVTQTWNRYSYVANNPVVFVDPNGLEMQYPIVNITNLTTQQIRTLFGVTDPGHLNGFTYQNPHDIVAGKKFTTGEWVVEVPIAVAIATDSSDPKASVRAHEDLHVDDIKKVYTGLDRKVGRAAERARKKALRQGSSAAQADAAANKAALAKRDKLLPNRAKKYEKKRKKLDGKKEFQGQGCDGRLVC